MGACCSKNMQVDDGSEKKKYTKVSSKNGESNSLLAQYSATEIFERAEAESILPASVDVKAALMKSDTQQLVKCPSPPTGTTCDEEDSFQLSDTKVYDNEHNEVINYDKNIISEREFSADKKSDNDDNDDNHVTKYVYGLLTNRRTNQSTPAKIPVRMPLTSRSHIHINNNDNIYNINNTGEESTKSNMSKSTLLPISESDVLDYNENNNVNNKVIYKNSEYINLGNISPNSSPSHYISPQTFITARSRCGANTRRDFELNVSNNVLNTQNNVPQHFRIGTVESQSDSSEWHRITSQDSSEWDFEFWDNFDGEVFEDAGTSSDMNKKTRTFIPVLNMELVAALRASENGFSPIAANVNSFKPMNGLISSRTTTRDIQTHNIHSHNINTPKLQTQSHTFAYNTHNNLISQRSAIYDSHKDNLYTKTPKNTNRTTRKHVMFAHSNTMPNLNTEKTDLYLKTDEEKNIDINITHDVNTNLKNANVQASENTEAQVVEKIRKLATSRTYINTQKIEERDIHTHRGNISLVNEKDLFGEENKDKVNIHKNDNSNNNIHCLSVKDISNNINVRESSPQPSVADERCSKGIISTEGDIRKSQSLTQRDYMQTDNRQNTQSLASKALYTHRRGEDPALTQMYTKSAADTAQKESCTDVSITSSEGSLAWTTLYTASASHIESQDAGMSFCSTQSSCVPVEEENTKLKEVASHTNTQNTLYGFVTTRRQPNILMDTVEEEENAHSTIVNSAITTR